MTLKKRILIFLIFVGVFSASYSIGAESPVSDEDAAAFAEEFNKMIEEIDAIGIFANNASIGLPMFIPGFGVAWGVYSAWSTGFAFSALEKTIPMLSEMVPLSILYASPFGVMELVAYSIGMSRSFILIRIIIKKNPTTQESKKNTIKKELLPTGVEIGIAIALLLAGGFLEHTMI